MQPQLGASMLVAELEIQDQDLTCTQRSAASEIPANAGEAVASDGTTSDERSPQLLFLGESSYPVYPTTLSESYDRSSLLACAYQSSS